VKVGAKYSTIYPVATQPPPSKSIMGTVVSHVIGTKEELPPSTDHRVPSTESIEKYAHDSIRAIMMVRAYRVRGHLMANLDPLGWRG